MNGSPNDAYEFMVTEDHMMEITVREEPEDSVVIAVVGVDFDMSTIKTIKDRLYDIAIGSGKNVALDFREVSYVDSSGLGILIGLQKQLQQSGRTLTIRNANAKIQDVLRTASLSKLFHLEQQSDSDE